MSALEFRVCDWLPVQDETADVAASFASFEMVCGTPPLALTEVEDVLAKTVRSHINVPLIYLAKWLLVNWWRLRWETRPEIPDWTWFESHSLLSAGHGYSWPPVDICSDGEFVNLKLGEDTAAGFSSVRYLAAARGMTELWIPAPAFELAVDQFVGTVLDRLRLRAPGHDELRLLFDELIAERNNPELAAANQWQARAGIDPGEAPDTWLRGAKELHDLAGSPDFRILEVT